MMLIHFFVVGNPLSGALDDVDIPSISFRSSSKDSASEGAVPDAFKISSAEKERIGVKAPEDFELVVLNDKFAERDILLKALCHGSIKSRRSKDVISFQPLDSIGRVALEGLLLRHVSTNVGEMSSWKLTRIMSAMLDSGTITFVALKNDFERFMIVRGEPLSQSRFRQLKELTARYEVYQTVRTFEVGTKNLSRVVCKMFRAVIGAVYVDSGYSTEVMDRVILPLFLEELESALESVRDLAC